jgi:hypothetical protein
MASPDAMPPDKTPVDPRRIGLRLPDNLVSFVDFLQAEERQRNPRATRPDVIIGVLTRLAAEMGYTPPLEKVPGLKGRK